MNNANLRQAVIDLIHQFKPPGLSDLEAAINVIYNHAETICQQATRIDFLESIIKKAFEDSLPSSHLES